ncbi:MAG: hypothetical protein K0R82_2946 [Flavipsychrobacter sp.]|jgi:hypothetical protein|nr:hypothetical protein [Flavipsychrobacter sp.]
MTVSTKTKHNEQRWAVVLSILLALALLVQFPHRIRLFSPWVIYALVAVEIMPLVAVMLMPHKKVWQIIERWVTMIFSIAAGILCFANLAIIINAVLRDNQDVTGLQLLISGLGVWTINIISFSMLYWALDRGGAAGRSNDTTTLPDWLFPQEGAPKEDCPDGWKPAYIDYLFLGYSTSAAFSPTDVLPLTHRAKLLMMLQSAISLLTILVVMSRAINILA